MNGSLTVEEALAMSRRQRGEWLLLGFVVIEAEPCPTYLCRACGRQRVTLKTPGSVLPTHCPTCGAEQASPPPSDHPVAYGKRQAPYQRPQETEASTTTKAPR
jgi:hypothetical protein